MTFSTTAKLVVALGGAILLGILGVLIAVLLSLEGTRTRIVETEQELERTREQVLAITDGLAPLLEAVEPLAGQALRGEIRRTARNLNAATEEVPDLAFDVETGLNATRALASVLIPAVQDTFPSATRVFEGLGAAGSSSLTVCDERLITLPPSSPGQLGCVLRTIPNVRSLLKSINVTLIRSRNIQRKTKRLTRDTRGLTRENLARFDASLEIQREILVRVESIDRKLGVLVADPAATP